MQRPAFNVLVSFLILFSFGAIFYFSPNWAILPIAAFVWFLFEVWQVSSEKDFRGKLVSALLMGLFLAFFDFAVENLGAQFGFWVSLKSNFFLLAVPAEIFITCLFGGSAFFLLISNFTWDLKRILLNSVTWSAGGALGEFYLNIVGLMRYGNGWVSIPHAFASYMVTWFVLHGVFYVLNRNYSRIVSLPFVKQK